jgi:cell fate regulator YaaT (PSP1 superfamily)
VYQVLSVQFEDGGKVTVHGPAAIAIHVDDVCVVEHNRVLECGRVVHRTENEGDWASHPSGAVLVRRATIHDQAKARENGVVSRMAMKSTLKRIEDLRLDIHLVYVRYSFDRSILHIAYTCEDRVECGELIKGLAGELRTRIELRQIGVRDAARLTGGMGACGRALCCKVWLKHFDAVSVKMAKIQRIALNPSTIGGMCGRLKCCLRYESDQYRQSGEKMPKDGAQVRCPEGCGVVVDKDVLAEHVKVRFEDGRVLEMDADQVKPVTGVQREPAAPGGKPRHANTRAQRPQSESARHP